MFIFENILTFSEMILNGRHALCIQQNNKVRKEKEDLLIHVQRKQDWLPVGLQEKGLPAHGLQNKYYLLLLRAAHGA